MTRRIRRFTDVLAIGIVAVMSVAVRPATAAPAEGWLIATKACEATRRIDGPNPGRVRTEPMRAYELLELHGNGEYARIRIPGAPQIEERWLRRECGIHAVPAGGQAAGNGPTQAQERPGGEESVDNVLAVSWQPAFCETSAGRRTKECRNLGAGDSGPFTRGFSLHGLWPQPRGTEWCTPRARAQKGPASRSARMRRLDISPAVLAELSEVMAGTQSAFQRYQFYKHGSCYNDPAGVDGYWRDAISLMRQLNRSAVARLFAENIGTSLSPDAVRAAFDEAFGPGAGERVRFDCYDDDGRRLYLEMRIALRGRIEPETRLSELILAAPPSRSGDGCRGARVDPAGNQ